MIDTSRSRLRELEHDLVELRVEYFRGPMLELEQSEIGKRWDDVADRTSTERVRLAQLERTWKRALERKPDGGGNAP